jgi:carbon storage regulator
VLVITRKVGQKLKIGDEINIVVSGLRGNQVQLGIDAPKNIYAAFRRKAAKSLLERRRVTRASFLK